jgi:transposase
LRRLSGRIGGRSMALLESSDRPLSQLSQELGIEQSVLRAWRRKLRPSGAQSLRPSAPSGNSHVTTGPVITADQAEIRRLRRELDRVQMERDISRRPSASSREPRDEVPFHR